MYNNILNLPHPVTGDEGVEGEGRRLGGGTSIFLTSLIP